MITLNFIDNNGNIVVSLQSVLEIQTFFGNSIDVSTPPSLIMDLMTKHLRYIHNGIEYYYHNVKMDNVNETIAITYNQVKS